MVKVKIDVDKDLLSQFQYELAKLSTGIMPSTARAMESGAYLVQNIWRGWAKGGSLPDISENLKRPSGGYARSIKVQRNGPFDYEIYSDAKVARLIEEGTAELDMKKTHPYGPRSRLAEKKIKGSPKGSPQYRLVPYLIIPFQWGTAKNVVGFKNIIPKAIYNMIKSKEQFERSTVRMTTHSEENFRHQDVERSEYDWGDRVLKEDIFSLTEGSEEDYNAEGMVAMDTGTSKKQHSGYFTFRVISADSPAGSWIKPAMPARHVTQAVAKVTEEAISSMVEGAIREDLGV